RKDCAAADCDCLALGRDAAPACGRLGPAPGNSSFKLYGLHGDMPTNSLRRSLALALLLAVSAPAAAENATPPGPLTGATIVQPLVALPTLDAPAAARAAPAVHGKGKIERTED